MTLPMIIALAVTVLMIILIMVDKLPFGAPPLLALLLLTPLLALLEEMQFPQELVVNATRQNLVNELKLHGRICAEYIGGEIL